MRDNECAHNNTTVGIDVFFAVHTEFIYRETMGEIHTFRVEAGSNTSTVALRVVGGDEKRSLEPETVKYCCESHGTRTRE
jgi:hypothetical protein